MSGTNESESFATRLMVPKDLLDGDSISPIQFSLGGLHFFCLGKFNAKDDTLDFILCGKRGMKFAMSLSQHDIKRVGWTVERIGIANTNQDDLHIMDGIFTRAHDESRQPFQSDINFQVERIHSEAFEREDSLRVPCEQFRHSCVGSVVDGRVKNIIGPWAFHGPSFPALYYELFLEIRLLNESEDLDFDFRKGEVAYCSSPK